MEFKNTREQGKHFEEVALNILEKNGYSLVKSNFYSKFGEIDIIVKKNNLLVFVEVKQRSSLNYGNGGEAITKSKRRKIFLSSREFLFLNNISDMDIRFDAIVFDKKNDSSYNWIKNVIWGDDFGF